jgi:hypothetical protein
MKMNWLAAVSLSFFSFAAQADNIICVMNYVRGNVNPCKNGVPNMVHVVDLDHPEKVICTRTYDDDRCKHSKAEFFKALGQNGQDVCVLNFNQEVTGNPCSTSPDSYSYVSEPW